MLHWQPESLCLNPIHRQVYQSKNFIFQTDTIFAVLVTGVTVKGAAVPYGVHASAPIIHDIMATHHIRYDVHFERQAILMAEELEHSAAAWHQLVYPRVAIAIALHLSKCAISESDRSRAQN